MKQTDKIKELEQRIRQLEMRPVYVPVYQPPVYTPPLSPRPYEPWSPALPVIFCGPIN